MFYLAVIVYVILSSLSVFLVRKIDKHYEKSSTKHRETAPIEIISYIHGKDIEKGKYSPVRYFISVIIVVICLFTIRYLFVDEFSWAWRFVAGIALGLAVTFFAHFIIIFFNNEYFKKHQKIELMLEKIHLPYLYKINRFRDQILFLIVILFVILLFWPSIFLLGFIFAQITILLRTHGLKMEYLQKEKSK